MLSRETLLATVRDFLEPLDWAHALWEGGSAATFYHGQIWNPLVTLLRHTHDPARFDYGARHLDADCPPDVLARVQELYFVRDADDLGRRIDEAAAWLEELPHA